MQNFKNQGLANKIKILNNKLNLKQNNNINNKN